MITIRLSPKNSDNIMQIVTLLLKNGEQVCVMPATRKLAKEILAKLEMAVMDAEIKTIGKTIILTPRGKKYAVDAI